MSQQVELLSISRDFENLLTEIYGAQGQGLHQKVNSVEAQLPPEMVKKLRFVASVRNAVVHKGDVDSLTLENIRVRSAEVAQYLNALRPATHAGTGNVAIGIVILILLAVLAVKCFG